MPINLVSYADVAAGAPGFIDFDTLPLISETKVALDGLLDLDGATFGERFAGQTLSQETVNLCPGTPTDCDTLRDVLDTTVSGPPTLLAGASAQVNLSFSKFLGADPPPLGNILFGNGPVVPAFPSFVSAGPGAVSVLFDADQSEIGFKVVGPGITLFGSGGPFLTSPGMLMVQFYRRDGSLIGEVDVQTELQTIFTANTFDVGFRREGGVSDIAAISILNNDPTGLGYDEFVFSAASAILPEPASFSLLGPGLAALLVLRCRRRRAPASLPPVS